MNNIHNIPKTYGYIRRYEKYEVELEVLEKKLLVEKKKSVKKEINRLIKDKKKTMKAIEHLYKRQLVERDVDKFIDKLGG